MDKPVQVRRGRIAPVVLLLLLAGLVVGAFRVIDRVSHEDGSLALGDVYRVDPVTAEFASRRPAWDGRIPMAPYPLADGQVFNEDLVVRAGQVLPDDVVVYSGNVRVEGGGQIRGDLFVFSGDIHIQAGGTVGGDLAAYGGEIQVDGQVGGSVSSLGGDIQIGSPARIAGDVSVLGGEVRRQPGANIGGSVLSGPEITLPDLPTIPGPRFAPEVPDEPEAGPRTSPGRSFLSGILRFFQRLLRAALLTLVVVVVAGLLVTVRPEAVRGVAETMQARPVPSFGVGLAAGLVALMAITILLATICLVPLGGVLLLGTLAVGMVGWAATGQWIGQRIGEAVKLEMPDLQATVVGTALMGGVTGFLWAMANCLGIMALMGLGATGLGATILGIQAWRTSRPQRLGSGESPGTPAPTLPPPAAPTGEGGESGPGGEPPAGP